MDDQRAENSAKPEVSSLRDLVFTARNVAGWLGGWLAVCHSQYCIKTTKPILKLFGPSGSAII